MKISHINKYFNVKIFKSLYEKLKLKKTVVNFDLFNKLKIKCIFNKQVFTVTLSILLALTFSGYGIYKAESKHEDTAYDITDNKAEEYFYEEEYDKAIAEYMNIFNKDSESPIWLVKISEIYSVEGNIEKSKLYIDKAKELRNKNIAGNKEILDEKFSTDDTELLNYIIFTEFMNKDYSTALKDGEDALRKYKANKTITKTMLTVYMANGQADKAKSLIDNYPVDKNSAYDMAENSRMKMLLDQWDEGLEMLKQAWNKDKDEYKIFDIIAQISAYNKDLLLEKITNLSTKSPDEAVYKVWLAKIYSMRPETSDMAQKLLDEVKTKDAGKIEIVLIQSSIYENLNKTNDADELINTLIVNNENDYRVLHTAGWYYLQKKDYLQALTYCKKSIIKNKNYPDNYGFLMPEILKAMGKSEEGEPYFRTALLKEPYNYNIMLTLSNFYWYTAKNTTKALEYFKFAEIVKPNDPEIKYNMAMIDLDNKKADDAISLLKKCIAIDDSVPKYHRTIGTIYMVNGKFEDGIKEIRSAYDSDKEDILTLNNAGAYYFISDQPSLSKGLYNFQKAYEGINATTDDYTKKTITDNYDKAKKFVDDYNNSKGDESLKVPDFVLFY
jgi:hypothetical protein